MLFRTLGISNPDNPFEEEFGSSSGSGQGVWTELSEEVASNLANTVVSIASFDKGDCTHITLAFFCRIVRCFVILIGKMPSCAGNSVFFACTGIIIKNDLETKITSFLTSLSLLRSIEDDSKIFHNMKVGAASLFVSVHYYLLV
jgi:hypothetical protein